MRTNRFLPALGMALLLASVASATSVASLVARDIPARLTDQEFWKLTEDISEPDGTFRSDNLLSNEMVFARLLPEFISKVKPGGVYLGVGPEQNFTYIVAMKAKMAFITDIRRNNLHVLLMYKALFELSRDRAEFVGRLFTKPRPPSLSAISSITEIMDAYFEIATADEAAYALNLEAVLRQLTKVHALPLPPVDVDGVSRVYRAFYEYGPRMNYSANISRSTVGSMGGGATYRDLMTQADGGGHYLTFLGTDERFKYIKDLYARNMIVPVVGNFSGPKAIRAIGAYLKSRGTTVGAFYVSTVEPYLKRDGSFPTFCENVAALPMDASSVFIRPGNVSALQQSGFTVNPAGADTPRIGSYQVGVVVPMLTGCS